MELSDLMKDARAVDAVQRALAEDVGTGDVTTLALVDAEVCATAAIISREPCRVAGGSVAGAVFHARDPDIVCETIVADGGDAAAGETVLTIRGRAATILTAERTALNFMHRM